MTAAGSIITIGTIVTIGQKIVKNLRKSREERDAKILQSSKEEINSAKLKLESHIKEVEAKLETLKVTVEKDLEHIKDMNNAEIKALGEKIQELRDELKEGHTNLLNLLSDLIKRK
jgi:ABC-type phosphate transport system auxiliary subunit